MKPLFASFALGIAAAAVAQTSDSSPAGEGVGAKMTSAAIMKASAAIKRGKAIGLTVDNRTVPYTAKNIRGMLYVPVRFFAETGQRVTWDGTDMRATIHQDNGPTKKTLEYDAKRGQKNFAAGAAMRPVYEKGRLWVPLASALAAYGHLAEWVPSAGRLNVRTNRG